MMNKEQQPVSQYDPALIKQLKKEIIQDIETQREWQEEYYGNGMGYGRGRQNAGRYAYPPPPPYYRRPPEVDYDWWADREEYNNQRNLMQLKNQLRSELVNLDKMNRRLGQINDPMVRQALVELLQEARQQGVGVPELIQSLNGTNQGMVGSVMDRVAAPFKGIDRRSFGWGVGAALLGLMFFPSIAKSLRSATGAVLGSTLDLSDRTQEMFARAKEEFEDIVAEAQYNKMTKEIGDNKPPAKK